MCKMITRGDIDNICSSGNEDALRMRKVLEGFLNDIHATKRVISVLSECHWGDYNDNSPHQIRNERLNTEIRDCDISLSELRHFLETNKINALLGFKVSQATQFVAVKRRFAKTFREALGFLYRTFVSSSNKQAERKNIEYLEKNLNHAERVINSCLHEYIVELKE